MGGGLGAAGTDRAGWSQGHLCTSSPGWGGGRQPPQFCLLWGFWPAPQLCHRAGAGLGGTTVDSNRLLYSPAPGGEAGTPGESGQGGPSWLPVGAFKEGLVLGSPETGPCSPPGQAAHLLGCPASQTWGKGRPHGYMVLECLPKATAGVQFPGGALGAATFYKKQSERGVSPTGLVACSPSTEGLSGRLPLPLPSSTPPCLILYLQITRPSTRCRGGASRDRGP